MNDDVLKSSVWRQYNKANDFREKLAEFCVMDISSLVSNEKDLYALMKAKLTKKELKLFAMDCASVSDGKIMNEFEVDTQELEKMKFKLYKKLKQDKTRLSFRASSSSEESA